MEMSRGIKGWRSAEWVVVEVEAESRLCQKREGDLGDDDSACFCFCLVSLGRVVAVAGAVVGASSLAEAALALGEVPGTAVEAVGPPEPSVAVACKLAGDAGDWGSEPRHRGCMGARTCVKLGALKRDTDRKLIPLSLRGEDENDDRGDDGEEDGGDAAADEHGVHGVLALDADVGMGRGGVVAAGEWDACGGVEQRALATMDDDTLDMEHTDVSAAVMLFSSINGSSIWWFIWCPVGDTGDGIMTRVAALAFLQGLPPASSRHSSSSSSSWIVDVDVELVRATPESRFHSSVIVGDTRGEGESESEGEGGAEVEVRRAGCSSVGGETADMGGATTMG